MVLLPPYLKDRRASGRTFGSGMSGSSSFGLGNLPVGTGSNRGVAGSANSAQRFLPLQHVAGRPATSAVNGPTGMRTSGVGPIGANRPTAGQRPGASASSGFAAQSATVGSTDPAQEPWARGDSSPGDGAYGNVVQLHPHDAAPAQPAPVATSAAAYLQDAPSADESALHEAWNTPVSAGVGMPTSTAQARERRRQVLLGLTGLAVVTLLFALFAGGNWIALHVLVDVAMLGYVILLVRHRQLMADRMTKVEPIRPPVNEQTPASLQLAPSYLVRSQTGT